MYSTHNCFVPKNKTQIWFFGVLPISGGVLTIYKVWMYELRLSL